MRGVRCVRDEANHSVGKPAASPPHTLEHIFQRYDCDKTGRIDARDFATMCEEMGLKNFKV